MRQRIILLTAVMTALVITGETSAQLLPSSNTVAGIAPSASEFRKRSLPVGISFRAQRNFVKMFDEADAVWYATSYVYIAKFFEKSTETMVAYGKRGNWLYTVKRYGENNLPRDVRDLVKSAYFDFAISHIDEVHVPKEEHSIYIIRLRNKKLFKTVRVSDREMDIISEYHE